MLQIAEKADWKPIGIGRIEPGEWLLSQHVATIRWTRTAGDFITGRYSREHSWSFDGGATIPASPSPQVVPKPWSNPSSVDPEEAFVAAVASCHMLTFLWLASKAGWVIDSYSDEALGVMTKNERGVSWVSTINLRPKISWSGSPVPSESDIAELHNRAHEECFIANSIKTTVIVEAADHD